MPRIKVLQFVAFSTSSGSATHHNFGFAKYSRPYLAPIKHLVIHRSTCGIKFRGKNSTLNECSFILASLPIPVKLAAACPGWSSLVVLKAIVPRICLGVRALEELAAGKAHFLADVAKDYFDIRPDL